MTRKVSTAAGRLRRLAGAAMSLAFAALTLQGPTAYGSEAAVRAQPSRHRYPADGPPAAEEFARWLSRFPAGPHIPSAPSEKPSPSTVHYERWSAEEGGKPRDVLESYPLTRD